MVLSDMTDRFLSLRAGAGAASDPANEEISVKKRIWMQFLTDQRAMAAGEGPSLPSHPQDLAVDTA